MNGGDGTQYLPRCWLSSAWLMKTLPLMLSMPGYPVGMWNLALLIVSPDGVPLQKSLPSWPLSTWA